MIKSINGWEFFFGCAYLLTWQDFEVPRSVKHASGL